MTLMHSNRVCIILKYVSLLCMCTFFSGCIDLDKNNSDSRSVTLKNFRSATELLYKTSDSDWIKIEDDPDDVFEFKTAKDKKYQIQINCPFNWQGKKRYYMLDNETFPNLDLGCDGLLQASVKVTNIPDNIASYQLKVGENSSYRPFIPCGIACLIGVPFNPSGPNTNKNIRIDTDQIVPILGHVCDISGECRSYKREVSYDELKNEDIINFSDLNHQQNIQVKNIFFSHFITGIFIEEREYLLSPEYTPNDYFRKGDGYFLEVTGNQILNNNVTNPLIKLVQYFPHDISESEVSELLGPGDISPIYLNSTFENKGDSEIVEVVFDRYNGSDLDVIYYSFSPDEFEYFVTDKYSNEDRIRVEISEKFIVDSNQESIDGALILSGGLMLSGKLKSYSGLHLHQPEIVVQDASPFRIFASSDELSADN